MSDLRYPIGPFTYEGPPDPARRAAWIADIAVLPGRLRAALRGLNDRQLDTPYRPGGWTVRQVAHHVPDSHVNAYIRFKLALTEPEPTIKPYDQDRWAALPDGRTGAVEGSLALLEHLHERWVRLLRAMTPADFDRRLNHPESGIQDLNRLTAHYAWHGRHHIAHVTGLRERMGW
jgi:hypothetical protein